MTGRGGAPSTEPRLLLRSCEKFEVFLNRADDRLRERLLHERAVTLRCEKVARVLSVRVNLRRAQRAEVRREFVVACEPARIDETVFRDVVRDIRRTSEDRNRTRQERVEDLLVDPTVEL